MYTNINIKNNNKALNYMLNGDFEVFFWEV